MCKSWPHYFHLTYVIKLLSLPPSLIHLLYHLSSDATLTFYFPVPGKQDAPQCISTVVEALSLPGLGNIRGYPVDVMTRDGRALLRFRACRARYAEHPSTQGQSVKIRLTQNANNANPQTPLSRTFQMMKETVKHFRYNT